MIMVIVGHDLFSGFDVDGRLADVRKVFPRRDLRVRDAVVRHQRGPRVEPDLEM